LTQKVSDTKIRKLALPLEIKIGTDGSVWDGLIRFTSKEVSQITITSIDEDNFVTCEISPMYEVITIPLPDTLIGTEFSKTRGRGKDFGKYEYYKKTDGSLYVAISGKRPHTLHLGSINEKSSPISIVARTIIQDIHMAEFSKNELARILPKRVSYGQMLKSILDVMKIEGYLEKREIRPKGRLKELFKATEKLNSVIVATPSPEQA